MSETGTATLGINVARDAAEKENTTRMTRTIEMSSERSMSFTDARIVVVLVQDDREIDPGGDRRLQRRQGREDAVDCADDVGAGLPETTTSTDGSPSTKPAARMFSTESSTSATSASLMAAPL